MTATTGQPLDGLEPHASIFSRVLVGIDDSPESLEAATQAATLATGTVTLLAVYDPADAVVGGMPPAPAVVDEGPIRGRAEDALEGVRRALGSVETAGKVAKGRSWEALLREIERDRATLVALGAHGAGRAKGILIGSTTTELVHKAPCSVLVARKPLEEPPGLIVLGVDGSAESAAAEAVAHELERRFEASLERYENARDPVRDLIVGAMNADLLVVGSRGLHGLRALGSVSERLAHEARCSVLIVR